MPRLLYCLLLLVMLLPAGAASAQVVRLSIPDTTGIEGDTIRVPVLADTSLTGQGILSYQLALSYSSYYLQPLSVTQEGSLSASMSTFESGMDTPGQIRVAAAGSSPLEDSGALFYVYFRLLQPGSSTVSFAAGEPNMLNEGSPALTFGNGVIRATARPEIHLYPDNGVLTRGDTQQFNVSSGTGPYTWSVTDPSVASIDANGLLLATGVGRTRVVAEDASGIRDASDSFVEVRAFRLSAPDTSEFEGLEVLLPIRTTDLSGLNATSGTFDLVYNTQVLTALDVSTAGTIVGEAADVVINEVPNGARVAFAGAAPVTGAGTLLFVRFRLNDHGHTGIGIQNVLLDETLPGNGDGGSVQVRALANLSVSPSSATLLVGETQPFGVSGATGPVTWSVSDTLRAAIGEDGLLSARRGGTVQVVATDSVGATGRSGEITIYDVLVDVADGHALAGDTALVPVLLSNMSVSTEILSAQGEVAFSSSVAQVTGIVTSGTPTDGWNITTNMRANSIVFAGAGSQPISSADTLFLLQVIVEPSAPLGASTQIAFSSLVFNEGSPSVRTTAGVLTVSTPPVVLKTPVLAAPAHGASDVPVSTVLIWHPVPDAETYEVAYSSSADFSNAAIQGGVSDTTVSISGLLEGTLYHWRVRAVSSEDVSDWSTAHSFTTATTPLEAPSIIAPADGAGGVSVQPTLSWSAVTDAAEYELQVSTDTSFASPVVDLAALVATSAEVGPLSNLSTYFWRVRARNSFGPGSWSGTVSFTTAASVGANAPDMLPQSVTLEQNYPNPFAGATTIRLGLPEPEHVTLRVYDLAGRQVVVLLDRQLTGGWHTVRFYGGQLPNGTYLCTLTAGDALVRRTMTIVD